MSVLLNTSDSEEGLGLIRSLRIQPLLVVLRPELTDLDLAFPLTRLCRQLDLLVEAGVQHVEIAWSEHPRWCDLVLAAKARHSRLSFGAASITQNSALQQVAELGFSYAMSPLLNSELQQRARQLGCLLVPGVMTPSEIRRASDLGCRLVKLFPASVLGPDFYHQIAAPMGHLPFIIAAGGLRAGDLHAWLQAGYDAIALGRTVFENDVFDPSLAAWISA
jgi:2-dehydro-3-deoxyphosphogluconate aldolase/(4S)-4-hydroxy-2-oxoglutarate aldolase